MAMLYKRESKMHIIVKLLRLARISNASSRYSGAHVKLWHYGRCTGFRDAAELVASRVSYYAGSKKVYHK